MTKKTRAKKLERLHISMSSELRRLLEEIQVITRATTASDVVRDALILYATLHDEQRKNSEFYIKEPNGIEVKYRVFVGVIG